MIELIPVSASATRARIYSMRAIVAIVTTRVESPKPKESSVRTNVHDCRKYGSLPASKRPPAEAHSFLGDDGKEPAGPRHSLVLFAKPDAVNDEELDAELCPGRRPFRDGAAVKVETDALAAVEEQRPEAVRQGSPYKVPPGELVQNVRHVTPAAANHAATPIA
ncbi:hypothetical protein MY8738_000618 [Beauveria namnaoensis]